MSLAHNCYQIDNIKRRDSKASIERVLPEYSCLLLSPANLWQQNLQTFSLDSNIVNTIFSYQVNIQIFFFFVILANTLYSLFV